MTEELKEWLKTQLKERRLSQNALAKMMGIGVATVNSMVKDGHTPGAEILNKLAEVLNVPRELIYQLAHHLPPPDDQSVPDLDALQAANLILKAKGKTMYNLPNPGDFLANDFWRIWQDLPDGERLKLIRMAESLAKEREQTGERAEEDSLEKSLGDAFAHS